MQQETEGFAAALEWAARLGPQMAYCLDRIRVLDSGCWEWIGNVNASGYGIVSRERSARSQRAHRVVYEMLVEPIPDELTLDHTCHDPATCEPGDACQHRRCVNPAHVEPVTRRTNVLRGGGRSAANFYKTHCPAGHPYDEANTNVRERGSRDCRTCHREAERERKVLRRRQASTRAASAVSPPPSDPSPSYGS